jgi:hypothetical protein
MQTKPITSCHLKWRDGIGFLNTPRKENMYGRQQWQQAQSFENDALYRALTRHRIGVVAETISFRRKPSNCLDVGIDAGYFMRELKRLTSIQCEGMDINPFAIDWLQKNKLMSSRERYDVVTFWGSLDHIKDPANLLAQYAPGYVVVSLPLYQSKEQAVRSPYYKPEHYWFFSRLGLMDWMKKQGYSVIKISNEEHTRFNQMDVSEFVFARYTMRA